MQARFRDTVIALVTKYLLVENDLEFLCFRWYSDIFRYKFWSFPKPNQDRRKCVLFHKYFVLHPDHCISKVRIFLTISFAQGCTQERGFGGRNPSLLEVALLVAVIVRELSRDNIHSGSNQ